MTHTNGSHASATPTRWRPARSGLINFYRYDQQEFHFHQGRLLLRGNNGTGKSRVLALQLPFLLDGEISPERVEPDCDRAKRFEWNLLMGRYDDRLGYTWVEFERTDESGQTRFQTLGCGVRAAAGRGVVGKWFFTTPMRIGQELTLCNSQGSPLSKDALIEAIGERGKVFATASAYREEVNHLLFGFSPQRYEAMVQLLIELRQPKLSRHLDEKTLSSAMSDALTPVRPQMIEQVSDAMRRMDQDRQALRNLMAAKASTDEFLIEYRRYAQIIAVQRSAQVRESHNEYERCQRRFREAESEHETAQNESVRLKQAEAQIAADLAAATERRRTLESSPEMKSARELNDAKRHAAARSADADRAASEHEDAVARLRRQTQDLESERVQLQNTRDHLDTTVRESSELAEACQMQKPHAAASLRAGLPLPQDEACIANAESQSRKACQDRVAGIRVLRELNGRVDEAKDRSRQSIDRRDQQAARVDEAAENCQRTQRAVTEAVEALRGNYHQWHASLSQLSASDPVELAGQIDAWVNTGLAGASPVVAAVASALAAHQHRIASARAEHNARRETHRLALDQHLAERDRLERGTHQPPPVPYTRDASARTGRAGATLWQMCEFAADLSPEDRAGLEAALESAGLLDAWIRPDGTIDGAFDTMLSPRAEPVAGPRLGQVIHAAWPSDDPPVPLAVVSAILDRIGLGESDQPHWVGRDGRWRLGPLSGRWEKPSATHIGQAARESARLARLTELALCIADEQRQIDELGRLLDELAQYEKLADAEAAGAPTDREVQNALAQLAAQETVHRSELARLADTESLVQRDAMALQKATENRDASAADLGLQDWVDRLRMLEDAIGDYRNALAELWSAARAVVRCSNSYAAAHRRMEEEQHRCSRLAENRRQADENARAARARFETLEETTGAAVQEIQRKLQAVIEQIDQLEDLKLKTAQETGTIAERIAQSARTLEAMGTQIAQETLRRELAIQRLLRFTSRGLLDLAHDSLVGLGRGEMAVTPAVELARKIDATLGDLNSDEKARTAVLSAIHNHIQTLANSLHAHSYRPETQADDELILVTVQDQAQRLSMREFGNKLADEIVQRRTLLSAKELELLENYLIHDVAVELGKLIREGEELVTRMNQQLARRPNSTGLTLRFNWQPDPEGPQTFIEARRKLMGDHATWSPEDRTALGRFLQEQINRTREADATGTWQEQLATALDYRRWHTFHVERRQDDRKWVRLTRKTHGTGSGGEKAVALTIPQFAAAAAYYDTALPTAPRLILLDEAFVGIDRDMRGKCMGLLHEFDLDFVMTSEIEWGCYPTIPGLAIYQLSAREGIDAVWASRWVWNGRERVQESVAANVHVSAPPQTGGLFAATGDEDPR